LSHTQGCRLKEAVAMRVVEAGEETQVAGEAIFWVR
jgi:hypothetical protein